MIRFMYATLTLLGRVAWLLVLSLLVAVLLQASFAIVALSLVILLLASIGMGVGVVLNELEFWF